MIFAAFGKENEEDGMQGIWWSNREAETDGSKEMIRIMKWIVKIEV